ncbi:chemotaxis protein CheA [Solemya pervernicosa gill symbiont]|uniref:Chemotaxis protein CheA n=2 Tax=Gammaproteobacteria incertae sedis TaxID=118884 RepID=A0A1T2LAM4_9GAMM|nr:chemotaxis protein CheA [Candidatus Reidiella endopervernicosa]OOZ42141.1 chemotaxis protein CheA [Solemya pervernicosa gill symbiont]QKQ27297.1 chemotaxis protein CheA [Candidatus Reidiella endopervernicosa]
MAIDVDDDILQDFLIEAGEILEQLGEQLVELEQRPKDNDLLNAVFRGFHTVKGGASFLSLDALVNICHRAEDVFNQLRNGERDVDATLMDIFLTVLDRLNSMFDEVRSGQDPTPAEDELMASLEAYLNGTVDAASAAEPPAAEPEPEPVAVAESGAADDGDITDEEFEALLDTLHDGAAPGAPAASEAAQTSASGGSEDISEDDFEALLDELHGGKAPGASGAVEAEKPAEPTAASGSDDISEDEFEALLDELHGGKAPGSSGATEPAKAEKKETLPPQPPAKAAQPAAQDKPVPAAKAPAKAAAGGGQPTQEATVRVDTKRLDDIMNLVGELVLVRNRLSTLKAAMADEEASKAVANLDLVTADLQTAVMKTRMQPIKKVFGRFPRVVRDLARSLKKEVSLELRGEETDLDKNLVEALADPLVHLVRNAVDHGIEGPDVRESAGKPRGGTVILAADQEGDHILITITDDGAGMDADLLRRKAVEKGMMDEDSANRLSDNEAYNLIFAAGFSTKTEISDVSGRGVGMDVVKTQITQLNGSAEIDSTLGKGSKISIKVPLTLAIMPTLMVVLGKQPFSLPLASVNEIFNLDLSKTNVVDGQRVVMVRNQALPLYYLREWLVQDGYVDQAPDNAHVVVVNVGSQRVGFVVDQLIGQEEVVIKPLGQTLHGVAGMSGATITGDGRIALILDVPSLMKAYGGKY